MSCEGGYDLLYCVRPHIFLLQALFHTTHCIIMDSILIFSVLSVLNYPDIINSLAEWLFLQSGILQGIPPVTLVPRFILNLRELYANDLRDRRGSNIDTAFGLGSGFEQGAARSTIVFAEPRQNENEEQDDEMEMDIQEVSRTSGLA